MLELAQVKKSLKPESFNEGVLNLKGSPEGVFLSSTCIAQVLPTLPDTDDS